MLWHCWLGNRKGIWPAKMLDVGLLLVAIWLCCSSSCHHRLYHPCSSKIQNRDILVPPYPGCHGRWPLNEHSLIHSSMMEVMVTTGAVRHTEQQSNRHHQQTNTQLFTGQMPFLSPNQQCQITEGRKCHISWTCSPKLTWDLPSLFWPIESPGYLGQGCQACGLPSDISTL